VEPAEPGDSRCATSINAFKIKLDGFKYRMGFFMDQSAEH